MTSTQRDLLSGIIAAFELSTIRASWGGSARATDARVQIVPYVPETVLCCLPTRGVGRVGYRTWDEYCETELGGVHLWLPREERPQVVDSLREAGRFTRTIASVTGQSLTNVHGVAIP
jgi:hypothetical protein